MDELCRGCGQPAVRLIGTVAHCHPCAESFLEPIRERVAARDVEREPGLGIGIQHGSLRPEYGEGWADLQCDACQATWTGLIGEDCNYCLRWLELAQDTQRRVLLFPDLPDVDDPRYDTALKGWANRLLAAVLEEIVTEHEARNAWKRQVPDVAV